MSGVPFQNIPPNQRVPLFYAEMDNSQASYFSRQNRSLIIGQKLAAGSADVAELAMVNITSEAKTLYGAGSLVARMHEFYRKTDPNGELWCISQDEPAAGAAAGGVVLVAGTATAAGTLNLYIAGQKVQAGVASGDTATDAGDALAAAINASDDLPVTAVNTAGSVALTCKWKGATGNDISLVLNFYGSTGGEVTPAGLTVGITAMSGGTANPDISAVIAAMGDEEFDYIAMPYDDATNLDLIKLEMGDASGRWSYSRQIYGHVWTAKRGTSANLAAFGNTRNDPHVSVVGVEQAVMAPVWEVAAAYAARSAKWLSIDPAQPLQTGVLEGVAPAPAGKSFTMQERQTLLFNGIATTYATSGALRVERSVTTYQTNSFGDPDPSYLDVETLATSAYVLRFLRQRITQKYPRHKIANDGTRFAAGAAIVTPSIVRAEILAAARELEYKGILENVEVMKKYLIVERDTDPNRMNILFPPDYINQLRVFAVLNQFRLQYPEES